MEEQINEKNRSAKTDIINTSTNTTEKEHEEKSINIKKTNIKNFFFNISIKFKNNFINSFKSSRNN